MRDPRSCPHPTLSSAVCDGRLAWMSIFHELLDSFPVHISLLPGRYSRSRGTQGPPQDLGAHQSPFSGGAGGGGRGGGTCTSCWGCSWEAGIPTGAENPPAHCWLHLHCGFFSHPLSTMRVPCEAAHRSSAASSREEGPTACRRTAVPTEAPLAHSSIHALACLHFCYGSPSPMEQAHTCNLSPKPCQARPGQQ